MSVYLSIDSGTPTFLASVTGWGDFSEWIGGQEDVEEIAHLCDHGWGEPATAIAESVRTALRSDDPSEDVKSTAENLLSILDGLDDEVVTVNDGMGPATEDFAEDAAGHEHDSKTGQFTGKSGTTGRTLFEHQNSIRQRANEHKKKNKKLTDEAAFDKSLEEHGGSWKQQIKEAAARGEAIPAHVKADYEKNYGKLETKEASKPAETPKSAPSEHVRHVAESVKEHGGPNNLAPLTEVRKTLVKRGITSRADQDTAIHAAWRAGHITGSPLEGRHGTTQEERDASMYAPGAEPKEHEPHRSGNIGYLIHKHAETFEEHGGQFKKGGGRVPAEGESDTPAEHHEATAKLETELTPHLERDPALRERVAKIGKRVTEAVAKFAAAKLSPLALKTADQWLFEQVVNAHQPGTTLAVKAGVLATVKAWHAAKALRGKMSEFADGHEVETLHKLMEAVADASDGAIETPSKEDVERRLSEAKEAKE